MPRLRNFVKQERQGLRKEVTEGSNKRKCYIQRTNIVFLSLSVLLSISDGETIGKEGDEAPIDNWMDNAGRLRTTKVRNLFRLFVVTSVGSGKLKLSGSRLLVHSFLTSESNFLGLLVNNSSILLL